jgi:ABC-type branched-subunit amino acid transport system substrate-binding protein
MMKIRLLGLACLAVLFQLVLSCAFAPKKTPPTPAPFDAKKELSQIQIDIAAGADKRAMQRLKNLIVKHPKTDVADDATIELAKLYFIKSMFEPSYQTYMSLVNSDVLSPNEAQALLGAAHALHKLGRLDEALALNARGLKIPGLGEGMKLDYYKHRYNLLASLGDQVDALNALAYIYARETNPEVKINVQARANDLIYRRLSQSDLEKVVNNSDFAFVRPQIAYRLAMYQLQNKDFEGARSMFGKAAEWGQGTPIQKQAESYLAQIDSRRRVDPFTVGTVLPLSGKYAPIAQKTLKGLQLGLGIYGSQRTQLKLAVADSEGTPDGARHGVERLVTEDSVVAIVGSLLSKEASAAAGKAEELGVPSIALSQKAGLTEGGSYIFRNAVTSEMQARELVRLAMDQLGFKRFAILYPNDSYGVEYSNLFWDEVLAHGGTITSAQVYSPQETDFRGPIRRLVGTYYVEDRQTEYAARLREWFKKQKSLKTRNSPPDDLLPPITDFDAIFVPDSPKALGQIAPMLAYQGVTNVRLLGTNVWNTGELVRRGQKNVENALFVDSNVTNDPQFKTSQFFKEFKKTFGEEPGVFEAQGYEAGVLLRQLILKGETTRVGLAQALTNIKEYQGLSGPMTMSPQRELVRPLIPLMVKEGNIVTWTPAFEQHDDPGKSKSIKK